MNYFDACYIAKFHLAEPDSPRVMAFVKTEAEIGCLLIGRAEVIAEFHRKLREGVVEVSGFQLLCDQFESDCASGLWQWRAVSNGLLASTAQRFRGLASTTFLRAADGLHLTCAAEEGCTTIHTSNRHMIAAAPAFGLEAVTF